VFGLDRLIAWSQRYRLQGTVLFSLLAINLLLFLVLVTPAYRHKIASEASLHTARSKLGQLLQYQKAQEAVIDLEKTFLTQQELALLTDRLPAMARRHQLTLPGVTYQTEKQKESNVRRIALNFKVTGRYGNIREFIHELEDFELFLYINNLAIASTSREPNRLDIQMEVVAVLR
jgi:Tfp pilus assembly protein PilO